MRKIFAITCHKVTNPLIHTVSYLQKFDENIIIIHVDGKSNIEDFLFLSKSNVHFISDRVNVTWGAYSQIESVLNLLLFSMRFYYDYFFLISGDDIPIKTNEEINEFLFNNSSYDFIEYEVNGKYNREDRVLYNYPEVAYFRNKTSFESFKYFVHRRLRKVFYRNKKYFENKYRMPILYKGTNWFTLKRETIKYILDFLSKECWYKEVFKNSFCADEIFFHTIIKTKKDVKIFNHPDYLHAALRYIDWASGPEFPRVLREQDKNKMKSSKYLFARKVQEDASIDFMRFFLE